MNPEPGTLNPLRRTLRLTLQYDGTDLVGWQRQPEGTSVQALVEDALAAFEGRAVTVHGAGRTDAGVHALAQVASVVVTCGHDVGAIQRGLNVTLPEQVRVLSIEEAPPGFHARFSAVGKVYEYRVVNAPFASPFQQRYAWHVPQPLDIDRMQAAATHLHGRHDFAAFQSTGSAVPDSVRTVQAIDWTVARAFDRPTVVSVTGDGFLRHMVRNIVGTLVDIGLGRWPESHMAAILASGDRRLAGKAAPARGLFLVRVIY